MKISEMTNEQIKEVNQAYCIRLTQLHQSQWMLRKELGDDNEAVQILWAEYLRLDEEANPFAVKVSQIMMQEQYDEMTEEEGRIFNQINY